MKKNLLYYFLLIILSGPSLIVAGTTGKIVGKVVNASSSEGLISANVIIVGTRLGATTDVDGYYSIINVPPGTYDLQVHYIGYAKYRVKNLKVFVDRTTTQNAELNEENVENGLTLGGGLDMFFIKTWGLRLDYAYADWGMLGYSSRISLGLVF